MDCSEKVNDCLVFGVETTDIRDTFRFETLEFMSGQITSVKIDSSNGFILKLPFENQGRRATTAMKFSLKSTGDSLFYEYKVGLFWNRYVRKVPLFPETYGLFTHSLNIQNPTYFAENVTPATLRNNLTLVGDMSTGDACAKGPHLATMQQFFTNSSTLGNYIKKTSAEIAKWLAGVLFQVYSVLSFMAEDFTHYDLHTGNVMMYVIGPNKYARMRYHLRDGKIVSFATPYLAKIIDGGRCFINTEDNRKIARDLCVAPKCNTGTRCGHSKGFGFFLGETGPIHAKTSFINSSISNPSHDLRLMDIIRTNLSSRHKSIDYNLLKLINSVHYTHEYGTKRMESQAGSSRIFNVNDASEALADYMGSSSFLREQRDFVNTGQQVAAIDVYLDGSGREMTTVFSEDMVESPFISAPNSLNRPAPAPVQDPPAQNAMPFRFLDLLRAPIARPPRPRAPIAGPPPAPRAPDSPLAEQRARTVADAPVHGDMPFRFPPPGKSYLDQLRAQANPPPALRAPSIADAPLRNRAAPLRLDLAVKAVKANGIPAPRAQRRGRSEAPPSARAARRRQTPAPAIVNNFVGDDAPPPLHPPARAARRRQTPGPAIVNNFVGDDAAPLHPPARAARRRQTPGPAISRSEPVAGPPADAAFLPPNSGPMDIESIHSDLQRTISNAGRTARKSRRTFKKTNRRDKTKARAIDRTEKRAQLIRELRSMGP